jgi:hypothetical protein
MSYFDSALNSHIIMRDSFKSQTLNRHRGGGHSYHGPPFESRDHSGGTRYTTALGGALGTSIGKNLEYVDERLPSSEKKRIHYESRSFEDMLKTQQITNKKGPLNDLLYGVRKYSPERDAEDFGASPYKKNQFSFNPHKGGSPLTIIEDLVFSPAKPLAS